ncbi:glycoside hydrolase family 18 [Fusarium heterosporum]|uniref:Glycoside hydrolase family 18 n=1 Tax=Fusarium heterosporum TaxID=42747 RepID=A0A8H5TZH1_FUSHE|nr:glycoside hydrolase family 18 [Fusarium heterosporum]
MTSHPSFFPLLVYCLILTSHVIFAAPTVTPKERQESIDDFRAALLDSRYNFTDGDVAETSTRLFGWQGCNRYHKRAIYSGWQQSWKIMDVVKGKNLNWNEAAAFEYLAPPFINEEDQAAMQKIIDTVATIKGGSSLNPFKWWLHVRCDDPDNKCPCGLGSSTIAYTTDKDEDSKYARINFCPRYFELANLDQIVKENSKKSLPVEERANLENYIRNKGHTWYHELLHIDWASGVLPGWHIKDMLATYLDEDGFERYTYLYGPERTKALARYKFQPSFFIRRNADSFAMYAMAKYVQKAIGKYPHLPLAMELEEVKDLSSLFIVGGMSIDLQGKTTFSDPHDDDTCQTSNGEDNPEKQEVVPFNSSAWFWGVSIYPEEYQRQVRGWLADATPHQNRVRIVLMQTAMGPLWMAFQDTPDKPIEDFCSAKILAKVNAEGDDQNLKFPTELPAFNAHGAKGCVYSGSSDVVGGMTCDEGDSAIRCWEDPEWREMSQCNGGSYMLGIKCDWK